MGSYKQISVEEAQKLCEAGATIVDIRDPGSFALGHLPGAQMVNDQNLQVFLKAADLKKPLVCYCYHGHSSQSASQFFLQQGFQEVYSMLGGFEEYRKQFPSVI